MRLALADWPRVGVPPERVAAIPSGRTPELPGVPEEGGRDFWLGLTDAVAESSESATSDELLAGARASGGLLAWARSAGGGSYRFQRVFV